MISNDTKPTKICSLSLMVEMEQQTLDWNKIGKIWGTITLQNLLAGKNDITKQAGYFQSDRDENILISELAPAPCTTPIKNIRIRFIAKPSARIIVITTPRKITENKLTKDYFIDIDELTEKTEIITFCMSLNKMVNEITDHDVCQVDVTYINEFSEEECLTIKKSIIRSDLKFTEDVIAFDWDIDNVGKTKIHLDTQINRFSTINALFDVIDLACRFEYILTQCKIIDNISSIQKSISGQSPYSQKLIYECRKCKKLLEDVETFAIGIDYVKNVIGMLLHEK
jgi:hypothetical protein